MGYREPVNQVESQVLEALQELERVVVAAKAGGPAPDLLPLFGRLDHLAENLPADCGALRHYLERKSYDKARQWLETEAGATDGVRSR